MHAAGAEHEALHAHAEVLAVGLEALPHEHAGAAGAGHLAGLGGDGEALCWFERDEIAKLGNQGRSQSDGENWTHLITAGDDRDVTFCHIMLKKGDGRERGMSKTTFCLTRSC
jgi:hypothetical protein